MKHHQSSCLLLVLLEFRPIRGPQACNAEQHAAFARDGALGSMSRMANRRDDKVHARASVSNRLGLVEINQAEVGRVLGPAAGADHVKPAIAQLLDTNPPQRSLRPDDQHGSRIGHGAAILSLAATTGHP